MKKIFLTVASALLLIACAKKETVEPIAPQTSNIHSIAVEQPKQDTAKPETPTPEIDYSGMVKVTLWSNRVPYYYRRKHIISLSPFKSVWKEDTIITTEKVVKYETYSERFDGDLYEYEYAMLATHYTSWKKGDSTSIQLDYNGKTSYDLSDQNMTFAIGHIEDVK